MQNSGDRIDTPETTIKVMIVDDYPVIRSGLETFLRAHDDMLVVSSVSCGSTAIDRYAQCKPDVTLLDLILPDLSVAEVIHGIRRITTEAKIIVLASFNDAQNAQDALDAGAVGYLLKDFSGSDLAETIRRVYAGEKAISPAIAKSLKKTRPEALVDELSRREVQVLSLIVSGLTTYEIANRLTIKPSSVKTYISRLYTKLNVYNRAEATAIALEYNLIQ